MGLDTTSTASQLPLGRLVAVGLIVFLANAALLVLQLVAGRLLAPFIGSSLETWTSVIGVFLAGIALGNGFGGKLADRYPSPRTVSVVLGLGALAAIWMAYFPLLVAGSGTRYELTDQTFIALKGENVPESVLSNLGNLKNKEFSQVALVREFSNVLSSEEREQFQSPILKHTNRIAGIYDSIPLGYRIPLLALFLCLPAGFILSLLTPLAIKLGLPDVSKTGRVAGMVFALSTMGCLVGNYVTGFYLIPSYMINTLVFVSAGVLAALSLGTLVLMRNKLVDFPTEYSPDPSIEQPITATTNPVIAPSAAVERVQPIPARSGSSNPYAFTDIRLAYAIVFLASFGGMALEMTASRVLAQFLGVSLFTWTGIIGVMLAGTALGNLTGGSIADRASSLGSNMNPRYVLAGSLLFAGGASVFQFAVMALLSRYGSFQSFDPIAQVICWTFSLFFLPMFALGTISPQVIRLAVPDVAHIGAVAGRVYAWSTTGAIVGTFLATYLLLSTLGMNKTILFVSLILALTSLLVAKVWDHNLLLYMFSVVLGGITGGTILNARSSNRDPYFIAQLETNYYTIRVAHEQGDNEETTGRRTLNLDLLLHSTVDIENPFYFHYRHEYVQMEFLRAARQANPAPRVLVVGGGGYTFPRYAMEVMNEARMDVVEIDPGVTWMAKEHLGLKDYSGLKIHHMDGRQYIAEKVPPGTYDLVVQDAVNDLSVPSHLLTKEYNDAVKAALKPNGVYLLTVIDSIGFGKLWKAAMHTLQETYPEKNVVLLTPDNLDPTRFKLPGNKFPFIESLLENKTVPQSVLSKLEILKDRVFSQDEFKEELTAILDENEREKYLELILEESAGLYTRQVLVIYASDRPVNIEALRNALSEQLKPVVIPSCEIGTMATGLLAPGGMPHALVMTSCQKMIDRKFAAIHTYRIPSANLQPYLDAPPRIILTDQFAPVDNLMADVFRYRNKNRPK
jgi:MFS family permease/uncharacterized membrane protein